MNSQLKEKLRDSSEPSGVEEYQPRCDFAVNAFKEAISSIDSQIEKTKGLINMEEGEEGEMQDKSKDSLGTEQKDVEERGRPQ